MADPRLIAVTLDDRTIASARPEVERERDAAVRDLLAGNRFRPCRAARHGHGGPYRLALGVADGRLAMAVADADGGALESILLGMTRFRRPMRDYFLILDSYHDAMAAGDPARIEPIDMARRGLHDEGAELLTECLAGKVELDFATARRLFTLLAALHLRG